MGNRQQPAGSNRSRPPWRRETLAVRLGGWEHSIFGEVAPAIFQTSTFTFPSAEEGAARFAGQPGYIYTRMGNPTVQALEEALAVLEEGTWGLATATGMAAIATVLLGLLSQGQTIVAGDCLYGPSQVVIDRELPRFGITTVLVDTSDPETLARAVREHRPALVFLETPANPTLKITDLAAAAAVAHETGALLVVDNTFATPYCQRPLAWGADLVVHSLTKALNGHSDVLGGAIIGQEAQLGRRLRRYLTLTGATMDPHQAWLILRGLRTLPLRLERAQANALRLAHFLAARPQVAWVNYPGLPQHPQHELARRQMDGFGFMISFGLKGGLAAVHQLLNRLRLISLAVSLGGVESLIQHPASMTHAGVPAAERQRAGITAELVRLSVGCEAVEDLEADLLQALEALEN